MKKILLLAVALLLTASTMDAQSRKTWDFRNGMSDATKLDLNTDTQLWGANRTTDDGEVYGWKNVATLSSTFIANGNVIKEFEGLSFGGTLSANSILIDATTFRLGRKDNTITLPKLANGQTVTLIARSANSSATDRGFVSGNANMTYVSGPDGGICLGKNAEGASEDGNYTLVWEVTTAETDSVECIIKVVTGGLDIGLIMIDNGDEPEIESDANVGFIYQEGFYADSFEGEPLYIGTGIADHTNITPLPFNQCIDGTISKDSLMNFDVIIIAASAAVEVMVPIGTKDYAAELFNNLRNFVPILTTEPNTWLGGGPIYEEQTYGFTVAEDLLEEELFKDVQFEETDGGFVLPMFDPSITGQELVYGVDLVDDYVVDEVLATVGGHTAIHVHGKKNALMVIPFREDLILEYGLHDSGNTLLQNAIKYLKQSKGEVLTASKPTATLTYEDGVTTVTLKSAIAGAKIYYTTDGSEPDTNREPYSEPLTFTQPAVLKAFVKAPAYYDSPVLEQEVAIKTVLQAPTVSLEGAEGFTTITLTTSAPEAQIYYSFNGQSATDRATLYAEPIVITEPGTITAFAYADGFLASDLTVEDIPVGGIPAVKDTLAHFNAGTVDWFDNALIDGVPAAEVLTENWKVNQAYYFGKSAWNFYSDEVDHTEIVYDEDGVTPLKDINGNDSIKTIYKTATDNLRVATSATDTQWAIKSNGQVFTGETNLSPAGYAYTAGASANRYYDTALDCIGGNATQGALTFGGKKSGEPYSGRLESTVPFEAPFDIVIYGGNGSTDQPNIQIEVSADGETWTSLGLANAATTQRHIRKTRVHYDEAGTYYVRLNQTGGASKFQVYDLLVVSTDGKTGIETATLQRCNAGIIYDLFGRKVESPVKGQIYFQDGKKMILR